MKIYHHNDLDGRCAGAIALRALKIDYSNPEIIEVDYKDAINLSMPSGEKIVIVDFSFTPLEMGILLNKGIEIIWIDHHKTAQNHPYQNLPGLRDFSDKGMSGCELTWKYFFKEKRIPRAVELIGDYDKWALKFQPECFQFYEGLKMEATTPESPIWDRLFEGEMEFIVDILNQGQSAIRYRDNYCEKICKDFGYEIEFEGHNGFATNFFQFGSKGFGDRMEQYDFCAAYIHDGQRFTVSLYSIKGVDVSEICKKYGGGGHKGAAGFVTDSFPFRKKKSIEPVPEYTITYKKDPVEV